MSFIHYEIDPPLRNHSLQQCKARATRQMMAAFTPVKAGTTKAALLTRQYGGVDAQFSKPVLARWRQLQLVSLGMLGIAAQMVGAAS